MMGNEKRGWIRIVEAFVSILLIAGAVLVLMNEGYIAKTDISQKVYDAELSILRDIELDETLRTEVLELEDSILPLELSDSEFPLSVKTRIAERKPNYINCNAYICKLEDLCEFMQDFEDNLYVQAVGITANLQIYNPRQVKLFCWTD